MISRAELKRKAKEDLKGNWGTAIAAYLIFGLILGMGGGITLGLGVFILTGVLQFGLYNVYLGITRFRTSKIENLFIGFTNYFSNTCIAGILVSVFTFLWSLLFIVPGIVKSLSYSMTFYILNDNPEMSPQDAIKESERIMNGHKMDLFILQLSFIGWALLAPFTFGLITLYLTPYMHATTANFYDAIRD